MGCRWLRQQTRQTIDAFGLGNRGCRQAQRITPFWRCNGSDQLGKLRLDFAGRQRRLGIAARAILSFADFRSVRQGQGDFADIKIGEKFFELTLVMGDAGPLR